MKKKLVTAAATLGLGLGAVLAVAGPAEANVWWFQGGFGSPQACEINGSTGQSMHYWIAYDCKQNNRPTGTSWDLWVFG
ncbi:hypothetical protein OG474_13920 [Kribbella sp. NBC_01505]|uniref:hypothetical protein n=1 Tax=Kribbella sp. NBC_01505 TaxID=2903580 RepID=UPI003867A403